MPHVSSPVSKLHNQSPNQNRLFAVLIFLSFLGFRVCSARMFRNRLRTRRNLPRILRRFHRFRCCYFLFSGISKIEQFP